MYMHVGCYNALILCTTCGLCLHISTVFGCLHTDQLLCPILYAHVVFMQDIPGTAVPPLPHTGDTELTTDNADRDEAETTTVSSVYTGLMVLMYVHDQAIFP